MSDPIRIERRGPVAILTLDRPTSLNALDRALLESLERILGDLAQQEDLRAVVVTGEGRAFAAGADIAHMKGLTPTEAELFSLQGHRALAALEELPVPTLAAVNGFALGGGCELALACDWIYASTKALFGQPEVNLGLIPGFGGTSRLVRRVGVAWAKELVLSGENVKADVALQMGLANRIFEPEELLERAIEMGQKIAEKGPLAVRLAKRVIQEGQDADVRTAHALEQQGFAHIFATEDRLEGMAAFLEKRAPSFKRR